eukprot:CAMPEP_0198213666 /NCGR_PEP_ID=MMETSP1445-20131203/29615_1 /TAXON_ID=36898 /ORGANISM="Pyramimonas sp., Strain CCMP2087" /LENGTH=334 /DNA_ID=CAMNT_0043888355 /DNA_START=127 /DNA_END=1132 /DNA_ORIENTATION=-
MLKSIFYNDVRPYTRNPRSVVLMNIILGFLLVVADAETTKSIAHKSLTCTLTTSGDEKNLFAKIPSQQTPVRVFWQTLPDGKRFYHPSPRIPPRRARLQAIPKTGSTLLSSEFGVGKTHEPAGHIMHRGAVVGRQLEILGEDVFTFTQVRSPFSRMVSWYRFCISKTHLENTPIGPAAVCRRAVSSFIRHPDLKDGFEAFLTLAIPVGNFWFSLPQSRWLKHNTTGLLLVDFVLKLEDIESDVKKLRCALGRAAAQHNTTAMAKMNKFSSNARPSWAGQAQVKSQLNWAVYKKAVILRLDRPTPAFYNSKSIAMVANVFQEDLELFGYEIPSIL